MCSTQNVRHPPYSPNAWVKSAYFLARDPSGGSIKGHRGDFWNLTYERRYRGLKPKFWTIFCPRVESILLLRSTVSRLIGRNWKIAPVPLNGSLWGVSRQKMSKFDPDIWAVRGGAVRFECCSSCTVWFYWTVTKEHSIARPPDMLDTSAIAHSDGLSMAFMLYLQPNSLKKFLRAICSSLPL